MNRVRAMAAGDDQLSLPPKIASWHEEESTTLLANTKFNKNSTESV